MYIQNINTCKDGDIVYGYTCYTNSILSKTFISKKIRKFIVSEHTSFNGTSYYSLSNSLKDGSKGSQLSSLWYYHFYTSLQEAEKGLEVHKKELVKLFDEKILALEKVKGTI